MVGKKLTKLEIAKEQQNREKAYNLGQMLINKTISQDYYNKKIKLVTIYGGMHYPRGSNE
jgi:hypothetical protein